MQDKEDNRFSEWDNYTDMELAEMWFDSRNVYTRRTILNNDDVALIVSVDIDGMEFDMILHQAELEDRASEWRYENE